MSDPQIDHFILWFNNNLCWNHETSWDQNNAWQSASSTWPLRGFKLKPQGEVATDFIVMSKLQGLEESQKHIEHNTLWSHPMLMTASLWAVDIFVVVYPPLLLAFVSMNCLRLRNYQSMLLLKCPGMNVGVCVYVCVCVCVRVCVCVCVCVCLCMCVCI